jgi:hypothetical protein
MSRMCEMFGRNEFHDTGNHTKGRQEGYVGFHIKGKLLIT